MARDRRKTVLQSDLYALWENKGARICEAFAARKTGYVVNSYMNYVTIAEHADSILKRLFVLLEESFPNTFTTRRISLGYRAARTGSQLDSRRVTRSRSPVAAQGKWNCMSYARSLQEWKEVPIRTPNAEMRALLRDLEQCSTESEEKFLVMPLTWSLTDKRGESSKHFMCLVVDLAPKRSGAARAQMDVTIIDVNGYGDDPLAYRTSFAEPKMGLNPFIKVVVTRLFDFVRQQLDYGKLVVHFPKFRGINVPRKVAEQAAERDAKLFPHVHMTNKNMEAGVCSIATMFVMLRLACDQRILFKDGIDVALRRFTRLGEGPTLAYRHVLFVRSFAYFLLNTIGVANATHGVSGTVYRIREEGSEWSIAPETASSA